jgi:hypothetical protein
MTDSASDLNELLYGQSALVRNSHFFIFTLKAKDPGFSISSQWRNPNKDLLQMYCVCLKYDDLVISEERQWAYQKCLCLVTFHACFELHFEVLTKILALKRLSRMSLMADQKATMSSKSLNRVLQPDILQAEEELLLSQYYNLPLQSPGQQITIPLTTMESVIYSFPEACDMDVEWCCPPFFSSLRFQDLFWLVCAVLLEKSVVFTSNNTGLLTASV